MFIGIIKITFEGPEACIVKNQGALDHYSRDPRLPPRLLSLLLFVSLAGATLKISCLKMRQLIFNRKGQIGLSLMRPTMGFSASNTT